MTGRAAGYCAGYATPGYANPPGGRGGGFGRGGGGGGFGRGGGRGWRNQFYATGLTGWQRAAQAPVAPAVTPPPEPSAPTPEPQPQELGALHEQLAQATQALNALRARVEELETKGR